MSPFRNGVIGGFAVVKLPITLNGEFATFENEIMGGRKLRYIFKTGKWGRNVLVCQIMMDGQIVDLFLSFFLGKDCFEFRTEDETVAVKVIFEGFFAQTITGSKKSFFFINS